MQYLRDLIYGGPQVTSRDKAVLQLKVQRDKIKQYQKRLETVQLRERELARQCLQRGDRERAKLFLRKEQYQRRLVLQTEEQISRLEELLQSIEFAHIQQLVVHGLRAGAQVLKEINAETSLEQVEQIMADSEEGRRQQEEVSEFLSEHISRADDALVDEEMERLEREAQGASSLASKKQGSDSKQTIDSSLGSKQTEQLQKLNAPKHRPKVEEPDAIPEPAS